MASQSRNTESNQMTFAEWISQQQQLLNDHPELADLPVYQCSPEDEHNMYESAGISTDVVYKVIDKDDEDDVTVVLYEDESVQLIQEMEERGDRGRVEREQVMLITT